MNYSSVKEHILNKLREELPKHLSYHNLKHTEDVIKAAERIAKAENINPNDLLLLKTAALFHDTGFLFQREDHEAKSCEIAQKILPDYNYSQEQINTIKEIIQATKLPQSPKNILEEIMADADLDYLGRADFFSIAEKLYEELKSVNLVQNKNDWNKTQESFLESHTYFTKSAKELREKTKQKNLKIIKSKLTENQ